MWSSNLFLNGYEKMFWGFYPSAGILHPFYLLFVGLIITHCLFSLYKKGSALSWKGTEANQIKYLIFAFLTYSLAASDFCINYGLEFYPLGFIPILISISILTYAIVKLNLLDIRFVIKQSLVYTILISIFASLTFLIIFLSDKLFISLPGDQSLFKAIVSSILFVIFFPQLKHLIQNTID